MAARPHDSLSRGDGGAEVARLRRERISGYEGAQRGCATGVSYRLGGRIASVFGAVRHETGGAVVALDNGDTFHGSMPAVQTQGAALVRPMSKLGVDAMTLELTSLDRCRFPGVLLHSPSLARKFSELRRDVGP